MRRLKTCILLLVGLLFIVSMATVVCAQEVRIQTTFPNLQFEATVGGVVLWPPCQRAPLAAHIVMKYDRQLRQLQRYYAQGRQGIWYGKNRRWGVLRHRGIGHRRLE